MDFITATILSGIAYDLLKHNTSLTAENLKERAKDWLLGDDIASKVEEELAKLKLSDEMSEKAIENKINESDMLLSLMNEIKPNKSVTIIQSHTGSGDNIGRDKIIK